MFYEEKVSSFQDLSRRLRSLDQDAGVRLVARSGNSKVLVFVTRFASKYTLMTYSIGREGMPGKRLDTLELGSPELVESVLKRLVRGELRAWVY